MNRAENYPGEKDGFEEAKWVLVDRKRNLKVTGLCLQYDGMSLAIRN